VFVETESLGDDRKEIPTCADRMSSFVPAGTCRLIMIAAPALKCWAIVGKPASLKERRLPSRRLNKTADWRPPLLGTAENGVRRRASLQLFGAQGFDGIDQGGSAGGQPAGEEGDEGERCNRYGERAFMRKNDECRMSSDEGMFECRTSKGRTPLLRLRASSFFSFGAESDHWIDLGGASRGDEAGNQ
jgi:hypothetical protein